MKARRLKIASLKQKQTSPRLSSTLSRPYMANSQGAELQGECDSNVKRKKSKTDPKGPDFQEANLTGAKLAYANEATRLR